MRSRDECQLAVSLVPYAARVARTEALSGRSAAHPLLGLGAGSVAVGSRVAVDAGGWARRLVLAQGPLA